MINNGDVFITKLERGFFGAFRVLKTGGHYDFSNEEFYLIALTSYADNIKPDISDRRLLEPLREKRFFFRGIPHINIYSDHKKIIEKDFEYLGNIPLDQAEAQATFKVGDGEDGGYPLAGAIQSDFGFEAFLEWRFEHEKEIYIKEMKDEEEQRLNAARQMESETRNSPCIKAAYRFKDEKSDKFWRIEYAGTAFAVNYGKAGTTGTYQVKEFCSAEQCEKEAKKLIASKIKKGYQPYPDFDPDNHFYIDDEENGLHPLTSHPRFRTHFTDDIYYDASDEEAPFGSDEGSDTFAQIVEDFRKSKAFDFSAFPEKLVETYWGMTYLPAMDLSREAVETLAKSDATNLTQSDMVTYATAFAQIKITGQIGTELKTAAMNAMKRLIITAELLEWNTTGQPSEITTKMINDLERF